MKIGFIGLGKLGLPCALAIESRGHEVFGVDPMLSEIKASAAVSLEPRVAELARFGRLFSKSTTQLADLGAAAAALDIVFVAVQTPHAAEYEGTQIMPDRTRDFDTSVLEDALRTCAQKLPPTIPIVVISTVLPGTMHRLVQKLPGRPIYYNPFFIAQSTVIKDFLNPEFVLIGFGANSTLSAFRRLKDFYDSLIKDVRIEAMSYESAELTKVAYNTFISTKILIANALMEICHKTPGAHIEDVTSALAQATDRVVSAKYMRGGMGDGGGCHPRDGIAMAWLAQELKLSFDPYQMLVRGREAQTGWLADLVIAQHRRTGLPIVVLGTAYKPEVDIETGSAALLITAMIRDRGYKVLQLKRINGQALERAVYFLATPHQEFLDQVYPAKSILIDPWRAFPPLHLGQSTVDVIHVGVGV